MEKYSKSDFNQIGKYLQSQRRVTDFCVSISGFEMSVICSSC